MNMNNWIKVKDELPPTGKEVIAYYKNSDGEQKIIRAFYAPRFTIEDNNNNEYEGAEYCEEKGEYFLIEGWYESNEHEDVHWFVDEEVTHWMHMPSPPRKTHDRNIKTNR